MIRRAMYASLIALGLLSLEAPTAQAQFYRTEKPDAYLRDNAKMKALVKPVIADAARSVVRVLSDKKEVCLGTVVGRDGWIVTKYSELRGENLLVKLKDGRELTPKVVGVEDRYDLAMLKVEATDLTPVEWRDSKTATLGHFVVTPNVDGEPITLGVVGVLTRAMKVGDYPVANRTRNSGWLGVGLGNAKGGGVLITQVAENSGGKKAGLQLDDVVLNVAGRKVTDSETMILMLLRYKIGEEVTLTVKRGDEEMEVTATLGKRPAEFQREGMDRGLFQNGIHKELSDVNVGFPIALQHDSVLKARDVGGPLVDLDGKVIGVNIASAGRVDSYTIPAEVIQGMLPELQSGKLAPPVQVSRKAKKGDKGETVAKPATPSATPMMPPSTSKNMNMNEK